MIMSDVIKHLKLIELKNITRDCFMQVTYKYTA